MTWGLFLKFCCIAGILFFLRRKVFLCLRVFCGEAGEYYWEANLLNNAFLDIIMGEEMAEVGRRKVTEGVLW